MAHDTGSETAAAESAILLVGPLDQVASSLGETVSARDVVRTESRAAALELIENRAVDCVVSSYRLPDGDGIELLTAVRERWSSMPFLIYATDGDEHVASEAIRAGVTDYLVSGAGDSRVRTAIESAIANRDGMGDTPSPKPASVPDPDLSPGPDTMDGDWSTPPVSTTSSAGGTWDPQLSHPAGLFALKNREILAVNDRFAAMFGYDPADLLGGDPIPLVADSDRHRLAGVFEAPAETDDEVAAGEARRYTFTGERRDGSLVDLECHAWRPIGNSDVVVGAVLDVTGREGGERQLAALRDVMRGMMKTKDKDRISELAVEVVVDLLDPLVASVALYDGTAGSLRTAASASGMVDVYAHDAGLTGDQDIAWDAFVKGEDVVVDDVSQYSDGQEDTPIRSEMVIPLGDHGVLAIGEAMTNAFDEGDLRFARTLATTVEMALDRADREETILERTDQLREQNEQLDRLRRIDAIVRDIGGMLVRATDRDAIDRGVCERLAAVDHWQFVWIGERPVTDEGITPRAWAGTPEGYLEAVRATSDGPAFAGTPAQQALATGDPQTRANVVAISGADDWRTTTLDHGFRSVTSIPLTYEHREYGVLEVYGDNPSMFGDEETEVLVELADMVAYAMNAVEREHALFADAGPEIEVSVPETETEAFFSDLAALVEGEVVVDGIVRQPDGTYLTYVTVPGVSPDDVSAVANSSPEVQRIRPIGPDDIGRFEVHLGDSDLFETVAAHGATIRGLVAESGACEVRIELPVTSSIRGFVEAFQSVYPGAQVTAQRSTFDADAGTDVGARFTDMLTDRQREVLQVAYHSGFFEWPRESTGEDIADALDVSPPTIHKHLRAAERKLLAAMLGTRSE